MVAPKLLWVLHFLSQCFIVLVAIIVVFTACRSGVMTGLGALVGAIIGIPLVSFFVRALFELYMVPFSLAKNVRKIRKWLFGCDGWCCGGMDEFSPEMIEAFLAEWEPDMAEFSAKPIKKVNKSTSKKASPKKPAPKKETKKAEKVVAKPIKKVAKK